MSPVAWVAIVIGLAASVEDLIRRHISDWIPAAAAVLGLALHARERGWHGVGSSLLGAVAGFFVFLIFFWLGGMGGGDIKLMTGFGALLGFDRLLWAAFWTAICGGLIAGVVIGWGVLRRTLRGAPPQAPEARFIPYAPAITLGAWLSLISG